MSYISDDVEKENKAYDYAMFLLNIRLRTEGELRSKMREKGYKGEAVDEVMARLKDAHYVNDRRFAEVYLENLKKYKSWGYFGIKKKFMEKKLPMDIIESVLAEGMTEEEELEIAKRFIKKYEVRSKNQAEKAKAARKLAAKGFRGSVVSKLIF